MDFATRINNRLAGGAIGGRRFDCVAIAAEADAEIQRLRAFATDVMDAWPLGNVDGCDLQEYAVKHGLLTPETRTAPCSEDGCNCAEYYSSAEWAEGITCYRRPTWMSDTEQTERLERERLQRESLTKQLHGRKPPKFEAADYGAPCFDED